MLHLSAILAILAAASVHSLPLNINLGAYSPALVVGDGEISFGGEADVDNLITALSGASATGGAAEGTTAGKATGTKAQAAPAAPEANAANAVAGTTNQQGTKTSSQAQAAAPDAAQASAADAIPSTAASNSGLQSGMGMGSDNVRPRLSKRSETDSSVVEVKEIEPREAEAVDVVAAKEKRALEGFNAALNYAAAALTTSPEVQLGTGEGGSGVGITVSGSKAVGKREAGDSLPTVTMLKIRTLGNESKNSAAKRETLRVRSLPSPAVARSIDEAALDDATVDQVNVNLGDAQDYELTITEVKP